MKYRCVLNCVVFQTLPECGDEDQDTHCSPSSSKNNIFITKYWIPWKEIEERGKTVFLSSYYSLNCTYCLVQIVSGIIYFSGHAFRLTNQLIVQVRSWKTRQILVTVKASITTGHTLSMHDSFSIVQLRIYISQVWGNCRCNLCVFHSFHLI